MRQRAQTRRRFSTIARVKVRSTKSASTSAWKSASHFGCYSRASRCASETCAAGIALFGGLAVPRHRLRGVLWHAVAEGMHESEVGLGSRISLLCRLAVPLHRLSLVLWYAVAAGVHDPESVLGGGIAL